MRREAEMRLGGYNAYRDGKVSDDLKSTLSLQMQRGGRIRRRKAEQVLSHIFIWLDQHQTRCCECKSPRMVTCASS